MRLRPEQRRGLRYSAGLHAAVILLTIFGLPALFDLTRDPQPQAFTVEILPISELSNVKNSQRTPTKKPKEQQKPKEQKKPEPPKPKEKEKPKPKPVPKVKVEEKPEPEPIPEPKKEEKKEKKKEEPKKKEKPKEKPKKEQPEDPDAILKAVMKELSESLNAPEEQAKDDSSDTQSKSDRYDPTMPLSISEMDMVRSQVAKYWDVPAGAKDAHNLIVTVDVKLNPDGSVISASISPGDYARYASDSFFRAAADKAVRAVHMASPLKNLPQDKYGTWKEMEITFNPKDMLF